MRSRVFRCLVCFLVAAALIFNLSPLKVHATSTAVTAAVVGVSIVVATAIGLQALGIRQGTDSAPFNTLVSDCSAALSADWAVNGLVTMLALTYDGVTKTYALQSFLQSVLDWLLGNDAFTVTEVCHFADSTDYDILMTVYDEFISYPYRLVGRPSAKWAFIVSDDPISVSVYDDDEVLVTFGPNGGYDFFPNSYGSVSKYQRAANTSWRYYEVYDSIYASNVSTSSDLTLESVGQDIDTDYETYVDEGIISVDFGIQFEDDPNTPNRNEEENNDKPWVPVRIPSISTDSVTDQTQADAQSGLTDPEIIQQLLDAMNGSGNGSGTGDNSGSGSTWVPPSDHTQFALGDLSKFFPFCIPFDLFDFFTLLNADPVAPVFSWEIQDLSGQTYSLTIDLSEWDPVAQLFRRLQLFLFICGLAAASRKYIKW